MQKSIIVYAAVLSIIACIVQADDENIENVLVTGSYAPQRQLTASSFVLEHEQIQLLNKRSVADILSVVPGLLIEQQGGPGGLTAISVRGAESNFTLVLLDGVPVNDPTNSRGGGFDLSALNPAMVQRVEVVRGAQSAIYGSDALAGVINIITQRTERGHSKQIGVQWGEHGFSNHYVSAQGVDERWDYSVDVSLRDSGEPIPGSTREDSSANLRIGFEPMGEGHRLQLGFRYLDGDRTTFPEQGGGPEYSVTDDLDYSDYRDRVYSATWSAPFSELWRSHLSVNRFEHDDNYRSPGIFPYTQVPPNAANTAFVRDQAQWVNTLIVSDDTEFNLGADYRNEKGKSRGYLEFFGNQLLTNFDLDRSTTGLFVNFSSSVIKSLLLQASARYDDSDGFDAENSFSIGSRYQLSDSLSFNANWGRAFKLPSFSALGHPLVGNPGLKPETATSWDAGVAWSPGSALHLAATAFTNRYENLVDFDSESFRNVNRRNVKTSGAEFEAGWQVVNSVRFTAQLTYTDIDVKGENTTLTGRPEWLASAITEWQFAARWRAVLDYRYTGEQWAISRHTGAEETRRLDDFHRLDLGLNWSPVEKWNLQLTVDNFLDQDYETSIGFPSRGLSFRAGVRYKQ